MKNLIRLLLIHPAFAAVPQFGTFQGSFKRCLLLFKVYFSGVSVIDYNNRYRVSKSISPLHCNLFNHFCHGLTPHHICLEGEGAAHGSHICSKAEVALNVAVPFLTDQYVTPAARIG